MKSLAHATAELYFVPKGGASNNLKSGQLEFLNAPLCQLIVSFKQLKCNQGVKNDKFIDYLTHEVVRRIISAQIIS